MMTFVAFVAIVAIAGRLQVDANAKCAPAPPTFQEVNVDGKGPISLKDLKLHAKVIEEELIEGRNRQTMLLADTDRDGSIDEKEYNKMVDNRKKGILFDLAEVGVTEKQLVYHINMPSFIELAGGKADGKVSLQTLEAALQAGYLNHLGEVKAQQAIVESAVLKLFQRFRNNCEDCHDGGDGGSLDENAFAVFSSLFPKGNTHTPLPCTSDGYLDIPEQRQADFHDVEQVCDERLTWSEVKATYVEGGKKQFLAKLDGTRGHIHRMLKQAYDHEMVKGHHIGGDAKELNEQGFIKMRQVARLLSIEAVVQEKADKMAAQSACHGGRNAEGEEAHAIADGADGGDGADGADGGN